MDININSDNTEITLKFTTQERDILLSDMADIKEWLKNIVSVKIKNVKRTVVSNYIKKEDIDEVIKKIPLSKASDKEKQFLKELIK